MEFFKIWGKDFSEALDQGNWEEVIRIKNESLPRRIYKYFPIFDSDMIDYKKKNEEKFSSLEKNLLWGSEAVLLNDPFELKILTPDNQRLANFGYDVEIIKEILTQLSDKITITSFSNGYQKRIPMWSHYTNNHKGYCVEFEIQNRDQIFPVHYSDHRLLSATIISKLCDSYLEVKNSKGKSNKDFLYYYRILMLTYCTKSTEWQYEREYRYFDLNDDKNKKGNLISIQNMGLQLTKIFTGLNCSNEYQKRIKIIGKSLGVPVYKMIIAENTNKFLLQRKIY